MTRYQARRYCSECQSDQEMDLIVEPDVVLVQCLTCLASSTLERIDPGR